MPKIYDHIDVPPYQPISLLFKRIFLLHVSQRANECNHLYFHTPSEPPLFKGDSQDVKNKKWTDLTFIFV